MKKQLIGFWLVLMSFQAMAVGHPHNLFSARKKLIAKEIAAETAVKSTTHSTWTMIWQVRTGVEIGWSMLNLLQQMTR